MAGESFPMPGHELRSGPQPLVSGQVDSVHLLLEEVPQVARHPVVRHEQSVVVGQADEVAVEQPVAVGGQCDAVLHDVRPSVGHRPDMRGLYRKQRHTAKRIFERLRDEHGFTGGYTIVKDYVREHRRHRREMFVPLTHPPGHAQADFGEAWAVIAGVKQKVHFFAFDLVQSDASYVRAYRAATAEAWVDGHVHAFSFFGAVALSIVYDNDRCLVSRIERDGTRRRTRLFSGFLSHDLIGDRYGRPGKGNDKGAVEGLVGWSRRNFMVPLPRFASLEALNG